MSSPICSGWFPLGGYGTLSHLILPAVTLGLAGGGWYSRMMRSSMIEVLRQDYIRTARAKGMPEWRVICRHALRNAILPIVAMIGLDIGIFMSGVVVVENVFGWPGIGQLMWQAIQSLDIPIIMGVTTVAAVFIVARQSPGRPRSPRSLTRASACADMDASAGKITTTGRRIRHETVSDCRRGRACWRWRLPSGAWPRRPSRAVPPSSPSTTT